MDTNKRDYYIIQFDSTVPAWKIRIIHLALMLFWPVLKIISFIQKMLKWKQYA